MRLTSQREDTKEEQETRGTAINDKIEDNFEVRE